MVAPVQYAAGLCEEGGIDRLDGKLELDKFDDLSNRKSSRMNPRTLNLTKLHNKSLRPKAVTIQPGPLKLRAASKVLRGHQCENFENRERIRVLPIPLFPHDVSSNFYLPSFYL